MEDVLASLGPWAQGLSWKIGKAMMSNKCEIALTISQVEKLLRSSNVCRESEIRLLVRCNDKKSLRQRTGMCLGTLFVTEGRF